MCPVRWGLKREGESSYWNGFLSFNLGNCSCALDNCLLCLSLIPTSFQEMLFLVYKFICLCLSSPSVSLGKKKVCQLVCFVLKLLLQGFHRWNLNPLILGRVVEVNILPESLRNVNNSWNQDDGSGTVPCRFLALGARQWGKLAAFHDVWIDYSDPRAGNSPPVLVSVSDWLSQPHNSI